MPSLRAHPSSMSLKDSVAHIEIEQTMRYTEFDFPLHMVYDAEASRLLKNTFWRVLIDFRFFFDSKQYGRQWAVVPAGFLTDGATIPRVFWWFLPIWGRYGQAAALHDYLTEYQQVYRDGVLVKITRKEADQIFKEALKVTGINVLIRSTMYAGVRLWSLLGIRKRSWRLALKRELEASMWF